MLWFGIECGCELCPSALRTCKTLTSLTVRKMETLVQLVWSFPFVRVVPFHRFPVVADRFRVVLARSVARGSMSLLSPKHVFVFAVPQHVLHRLVFGASIGGVSHPLSRGSNAPSQWQQRRGAETFGLRGALEEVAAESMQHNQHGQHSRNTQTVDCSFRGRLSCCLEFVCLASVEKRAGPWPQ